jgi:hypothetical protein
MTQLATSFQEYGEWRKALAQSVVRLRGWLDANQLLEADFLE